jgi:hypothetical protein
MKEVKHMSEEISESIFDSVGVKKKESKDRMALYISPSVAKEFKKLAIDEGTDYSTLAEKVFEAFLKSKGRIK